MKKSNLPCLLAIAVLVLITIACASGNPLANPEAPAGFLKGLWDGFTIEVSWVISLFNSNYGIYEVVNSGGWYNFGYLIGIGCMVGLFRVAISLLLS